MTKKVAIYTRVSTLDQTIDNQLIELRDHCSRMGWEVVKEYADEGLSGTLSRDKRPALNSLIKDAYRKRFDSVVCWDISRIGRSMKELILFLSDMKDRGIGICSVRQGFDTSTSMGEISDTYQINESDLMRRAISEFVQTLNANPQDNGKLIFV